jgi:hypothetical protein
MNPDRRRLIISAAGVAVGGMATVYASSPKRCCCETDAPALPCSDHFRGGILRESRRRCLVSGLREFHLELARKIRAAQTEPSGIHRRRRSEYESRAGGCSGEAFLKLGATAS